MKSFVCTTENIFPLCGPRHRIPLNVENCIVQFWFIDNYFIKSILMKTEDLIRQTQRVIEHKTMAFHSNLEMKTMFGFAIAKVFCCQWMARKPSISSCTFVVSLSVAIQFVYPQWVLVQQTNSSNDSFGYKYNQWYNWSISACCMDGCRWNTRCIYIHTPVKSNIKCLFGWFK